MHTCIHMRGQTSIVRQTNMILSAYAFTYIHTCIHKHGSFVPVQALSSALFSPSCNTYIWFFCTCSISPTLQYYTHAYINKVLLLYLCNRYFLLYFGAAKSCYFDTMFACRSVLVRLHVCMYVCMYVCMHI